MKMDTDNVDTGNIDTDSIDTGSIDTDNIDTNNIDTDNIEIHNTYCEELGRYAREILQKSTPELPYWNREQFEREKGVRPVKPSNWNYVNAVMIRAMLDIYERTNDEDYLVFADDFMDYFVGTDGTILTYKQADYSLDHLCGGGVLLRLYHFTGKEKYLLAAKCLRAQLDTQMRTKCGSFWHKKVYPNQVWLDGLYMAQPFYMEYESRYGTDIGCRDSFLQFQNVRRFMKDKDTGLYYHGYDASKAAFWCDSRTGCSKSFWLRSLGWFLMACVDTLEVMPERMKDERADLSEIFTELIQSVLHYRDEETGMFYQVPDKKESQGNYPETSGSSAIAYAILKAARLGIIDNSYRHVGYDIFTSICRRYLTFEDGRFHIGGICLVAGLGGNTNRRDGTYEYYVSEPVVKDDGKGAAPLLMTYAEILRTKEL